MAEQNNAKYSDQQDKYATGVCDACNFGQRVNTVAVAYCETCLYFLCDECEKTHQSITSKTQHTLVQLNQEKRRLYKQQSLISAAMTCTVHDEESIIYFCLSHAVVICDRCKREKHEKCEVKTVQEVAQETQNNSGLFLENTKSLSAALQILQDSWENNKKRIEMSSKSSEQNVFEEKQEVIEWIERLAQHMEESISETKKKLVTEVESDIKTTNEMSKEIQKLNNSLECIGNSNEAAKFVLMMKMKQIKDEGKQSKDDILKKVKTFRLEFHKSDQLGTLMSKVKSIGTLHTHDPVLSPKQIPLDDSRFCFEEISSVIRRYSYIGSINDVTGCVFMPDGRLVVCIGYGKGLVKVLSEDFEPQSMIEISSIWDAAVVSENQVIVSQVMEKCIQFLNISGTITKGKTIAVGMKCWGVECKYDKIYVTCHDESGNGGTVKILTLTGDTLSTCNVPNGYPTYLAVNISGDRIFVSTHPDVQSIGINITEPYKYSNSQLTASLGLLVDAYDNVMVCGRDSNNLHVVKSNGTKKDILLTSKDGINGPLSLAFRPKDKILVIGQRAETVVFKIN